MFDVVVWATFAMIGAGQQQDCRAIADATLRLACYDARDRVAPPAPPAPARAPIAPDAPAPREAVAVAPAPAPVAAPAPAARRSLSSAEIIRADPTGRIVAVTRLRHGLHRMTLDDGRAFDTTTDAVAPAPVGSAVRLRRTTIGTTFLDVDGREPLTVRLVRAQD